jgi:hypothetical protein
MQVRTNVKAGGISWNHNESQVRPAGLKVQTGAKAGICPIGLNHNEAQVRGLKVRTNVKAGHATPCPPPTNGKGKPN